MHSAGCSGVVALLALSVALSGCDTRDGEPVATPGATTPAIGADREPPGVSAPEPPEAVREGELLLATPPEGWKVTGSVQTQTLRMAEYQPPDQAEGRVERLTFEAQSADPLPDPIAFVLGVSKDLETRCEGFQDLNISSGFENGYPSSVELMVCPKFKDSDNGQVMMTKAVQGGEKFYVITHRMLTPPMRGQGPPLTAQAMADWTTRLKRIQVCDTRGTLHPCPDAGAADAAHASPGNGTPAADGH